MADVSAEQIIALEAALSDLSDLYAIGRTFTALQARAEGEWLPRLNALGAGLRRRLRSGELDDAAIERTATEILGYAALWRSELEALRSSPVYLRALRAVAENRQGELAEVIPAVFALLHVVRPVPSLHFPVSPTAGRRRPGASPFLSPAECADRIGQLMAAGIPSVSGSADWWERELPSIACSDTAAGLETPIALRVAAADVRVTVSADAHLATLRVFASRLCAPMTVVLARDATDEWWEAYEDSYRSFRDALEQELAARGQKVIEE